MSPMFLPMVQQSVDQASLGAGASSVFGAMGALGMFGGGPPNAAPSRSGRSPSLAPRRPITFSGHAQMSDQPQGMGAPGAWLFGDSGLYQ